MMVLETIQCPWFVRPIFPRKSSRRYLVWQKKHSTSCPNGSKTCRKRRLIYFREWTYCGALQLARLNFDFHIRESAFCEWMGIMTGLHFFLEFGSVSIKEKTFGYLIVIVMQPNEFFFFFSFCLFNKLIFSFLIFIFLVSLPAHCVSFSRPVLAVQFFYCWYVLMVFCFEVVWAFWSFIWQKEMKMVYMKMYMDWLKILGRNYLLFLLILCLVEVR